MSKKKLWIGLSCYAILAMAAFTLREQKMRQVVWIVLAGLAVKSGIAAAHHED